MLEEAVLARLLAPYLGGGPVPDQLFPKLRTYLELLQRWNTRTNLTAIREPVEMVTRHFGESLFASRVLEREGRAQGTLLDFGAGAGFPGLPVQLLLPGMRVTLAESQGKKAAFLREAVRSLGLETEVWAGRVEALAADRHFDVVAMRAVDDMARMAPVAAGRLRADGVLLTFTGEAASSVDRVSYAIPGRQASYVHLQPSSMFHVEQIESHG